MGFQIDGRTARYMAEVQTLPTLTREEELALARAFHDRGDKASGDRLIASSLRHVVPMALRYRNLGVPVADLIAQGSLGLLEALRRFEPARELRFATYANHWIRSEMLTLVLKSRHMVGGGRGDLRAAYAFRLRREHSLLQARFATENEVMQELAARYEKSQEDLTRILMRLEQRDASLDATFSPDSSATLLDQMSGDEPHGEDALPQSIAHPQLQSLVEDAQAALNERERFIVEHRFMADAESQWSLQQIGVKFGVSRERARQIEQRVKEKLRERLAQVANPSASSSAAA